MRTDEEKHVIHEYEVAPFRTPLWVKYGLDIQYTEKDFEGEERPTKKLLFVSACHNLVCEYLEKHPEIAPDLRYFDVLDLAMRDL